MKLKIIPTLLALGVSSNAAIVVTEDFTYANGVVDATENGGTGWAGAWGSTDGTAAQFEIVNGEAILMEDQVNHETIKHSRAFASAYTLDTNTTLTLTFNNIVLETQSGRGIGLNLTDSTNGQSIFIGKQLNEGNSGGIHGSITAGGTDHAVTTNGSGSAFLTAVLTSDGTDTFVSINDGSGAVTGTIAGTQYIFDGLDITGYHKFTTTNGVDNISIDVTVVPEPSSTALLGLGGLALILRRRK